MREMLTGIGVDVVGALATALATWLLWRVGSWFKTKTQNDRVKALIDVATQSAQVAVRAVDARLRPGIKAAAADGKRSPAEGAGLRVAAVEAMRRDMGPAATDLLQRSLKLGEAEFETWLARRVEAANVDLSSKSAGLR